MNSRSIYICVFEKYLNIHKDGNIISALMKSLLRNDFTITKERTATTETPIVLKVVMEPTNVDVVGHLNFALNQLFLKRD